MHEWMEKIVILDTETTAVDPYKARIIEFGMISLDQMEEYATYVNPGDDVIIPDAVQEITGITRENLHGAPNTKDILAYLTNSIKNKVVFAHNGLNYDFPLIYSEAKRLGMHYSSIGYGCTLKMARQLWPQFEQKDFKNPDPQRGYALGPLLFQLAKDSDGDFYNTARLMEQGRVAFASLVQMAQTLDTKKLHGALTDCQVTMAILKYAVEKFEINSLHELMELCGGHPDMEGDFCPYKKYKDLAWKDVPTDYLFWLVKQSWFTGTYREKVERILVNDRQHPLPSVPISAL